MKKNKIECKSDCRGWEVEDVVDQIFKDRGISNPEHFLNPTVEDMLPLTDLKNIEEAADIVIENVRSGNKIGVYGDVDVDGLTSTTIIYRYLKRLDPNIDIQVFLNHGKSHGLQKYNLDECKKCDILIVVDSLDSTAFLYEEVQTCSNVTDVIVLDHHSINPKVPYDKWITLVSSQRDYGNPELSGAGVCMKFVLYLDELLGLNYADDLYDLCASGLCADMMNMTVPENRYLMSRGLEEINNPAIEKLAGGFGWDSKSIAFSIAPAVNASMRLDKNEYALKAFLADDNKEILENVKVLKKCKDEQNKEIDAMMPAVLKQCQQQLDKKMIVVFIQTESGISGLLANRLLDKYKRPIVVLKEDEDYYKGSMRGYGVEDFQAMINESKLGSSFGHPLAASCEVKKKNFQKFVDYMEEHLPDVGSFEETIEADIAADVEDIDYAYVNKIQELNKISGTGFKAVRVYLSGITDYEIGNMSKGKHLVIKTGDSDLTLIKWNFDGDWEKLKDASMMGDELECVCELQSGWIGRTFMLQGIINWLNIKE